MYKDNFTLRESTATSGSAAVDTYYTSSGSSPPTILDAALAYSRQGLRVVPVEPRLKSPWHRPKGYQQRPAAKEAEIREWFADEPNLNIGILTGQGIIVLDVDEHRGKMSGSECLRQLEEMHGPLPKTLTSITGGGGQHLIFRLPPGQTFGGYLPVIRAFLRATTGKATGGVIDVRGDGLLIVLPPSVHPSGNLYRWEDPEVEVATLPLAWCEKPFALALRDPERRTRTGKPAPRRTIAPDELDALQLQAYERMVNINPNALLGRETLLLLANGDPDDEDRTHHMWRIILGAARVRFDPDRLYQMMLNAPGTRDGLLDHGRDWFDANMLRAHREIVEQTLTIEDLARLRLRADDLESRVLFSGRNGRRRTILAKNVRKAWYALLELAREQETTAPMVGTLLLPELAARFSAPDEPRMARDTARKALEAIESLGWCYPEDVHSGGATSAYRYHLILDEIVIPSGRATSMRRKKEIDTGAWLTELLRCRGGAMRSREIQSIANGCGINSRTLRRHAQRLGVRTVWTSEGTTEWHL